MHTYQTKMDVLMRKIRDRLGEITKIRINNRSETKKYLTWKMFMNNIYMYDCGENYATVYTLHSTEELMREIGRSVNNATKEIAITYTNETTDIIRWT